MLWVPLPHRYVVPRAVILAVLGPVGLARLVATAGGWARFAVGPAAAALLVWAWTTDSAQRQWWLQHFEDGHNRQRQEAIRHVQRELGAAPGPLLDCSAQYVQTALLPELLGPEPPLLRVRDAERCLTWVRSAPAGAWLAADANQELRVLQRSTAPGMARFDAAVLEPAGWTRVVDAETFQLWRRPAGP